MGCSVGRGARSSMSLGGRGAEAGASATERDEVDARTRLERKLYLARESPEPTFELTECALRKVPAGVYSVCRVLRKERLLLDDNRLRSLEGGGELADLYLLRGLSVSRNLLSELDSDVKHLINLMELNLSDNRLSHLPESIGQLASLHTLDISHNSLKELPRSIGQLKSLRLLKITNNPTLTVLCPELCGATNVVSIELDFAQFSSPTPEVAAAGTTQIMMFLCNKMNVPYSPPSDILEDMSPVEQSPNYLEKAFQKDFSVSWEEQEALMIEQERKIHEASKLQREEFLSKIVKEQTELDAEISKIQIEKEAERQKLIGQIQNEESLVAEVVNSFLNSNTQNPEILQQQLEHEQMEHDRLLDMCRENYHNIRKVDILKAMESLLKEEVAFQLSIKSYEDSLGDVKRSMLLHDFESSEKLAQIFKVKDESHSALVEQLLEDQNIQKVMVASLLERVDARSWSLNQEISIVTTNLAKLSVIEQEKQRLKVNYNYNQLLHQRVQLLNLLDNLLDQQGKRRAQLIETLKDMESEASEKSDFWLANYQRLMDSAPKSLLEAGQMLDPMFANCLLQEGVIHCLPFLVKLIFSSESLADITHEHLKENGVNLLSDRCGILRAIECYIDIKTKEKHEQFEEDAAIVMPSAPMKHEIENEKEVFSVIIEGGGGELAVPSSECVICMDAKCEVVFIPCAHLCCCSNCADKEVNICPMCRGAIEKKIKVIIP